MRWQQRWAVQDQVIWFRVEKGLGGPEWWEQVTLNSLLPLNPQQPQPSCVDGTQSHGPWSRGTSLAYPVTRSLVSSFLTLRTCDFLPARNCSFLEISKGWEWLSQFLAPVVQVFDFFFLNYPIEFHMSAILGKWLVELTDPECFNGWKVSICVCLWGSALSLYSRWICNCGVWHPTLPVGNSALFFPAFSLELPAVSIQLRRFPNLPLFRSFAPVNPKIIQLQGVHQLSPILLFTCGDPVKSGGDLVGCFSNSLSMWPPGL